MDLLNFYSPVDNMLIHNQFVPLEQNMNILEIHVHKADALVQLPNKSVKLTFFCH